MSIFYFNSYWSTYRINLISCINSIVYALFLLFDFPWIRTQYFPLKIHSYLIYVFLNRCILIEKLFDSWRLPQPSACIFITCVLLITTRVFSLANIKNSHISKTLHPIDFGLTEFDLECPKSHKINILKQFLLVSWIYWLFESEKSYSFWSVLKSFLSEDLLFHQNPHEKFQFSSYSRDTKKKKKLTKFLYLFWNKK